MGGKKCGKCLTLQPLLFLLCHALVQSLRHLPEVVRRESDRLVGLRVLLRDHVVYLFQQHAYLLHQLCPVLLGGFPPDERVFVGLRFDLRPVYITPRPTL